MKQSLTIFDASFLRPGLRRRRLVRLPAGPRRRPVAGLGGRADGEFRAGHRRPGLQPQRQQQPAHARGGRGGDAQRCGPGRSSKDEEKPDSLHPSSFIRHPSEFGRLLLIGALAGFAYALEQPTGGLLLAAAAVAAAVRLRWPTAVVWVVLAALPWMVAAPRRRLLLRRHARAAQRRPRLLRLSRIAVQRGQPDRPLEPRRPRRLRLLRLPDAVRRARLRVVQPHAVPGPAGGRVGGAATSRRSASACGPSASGSSTPPCPTTTAAPARPSAGSCRCWRRPTSGWPCCCATGRNSGSTSCC